MNSLSTSLHRTLDCLVAIVPEMLNNWEAAIKKADTNFEAEDKYSDETEHYVSIDPELGIIAIMPFNFKSGLMPERCLDAYFPDGYECLDLRCDCVLLCSPNTRDMLAGFVGTFAPKAVYGLCLILKRVERGFASITLEEGFKSLQDFHPTSGYQNFLISPCI